MGMINCRECRAEISSKATACPKCGAPAAKAARKLGCGGCAVVGIVLIIGIGAITSARSDNWKADAVRQAADQEHAAALAAQSAQASAKTHFMNTIDIHYERLKKRVADGDLVAAFADIELFEKNGQGEHKDVPVFRKAVKPKILSDRIAKLPESDTKGRLILYRQLVAVAADDIAATSELARLEKAHAEAETARIEKDRLAADAAAMAEARQKEIAVGFSPWDGSHNALEKHIKKQMKNPDSYKHVQTTYVDRGAYLIVETTYRGTNSFNAIVPNTVRAKADLDGKLLEIISE